MLVADLLPLHRGNSCFAISKFYTGISRDILTCPGCRFSRCGMPFGVAMHWKSSRAATLCDTAETRSAAADEHDHLPSHRWNLRCHCRSGYGIRSNRERPRQALRHGPGLWSTSPASSGWPLETSKGSNSMAPGNPIVLGAESLPGAFGAGAFGPL